jgi:hypothetical protein
VDCSGGDVTKVGILEEALHQVWQPLQPVQRRQCLGFEVIGAGDVGAADPVVLDVLPHPFMSYDFTLLHREPGDSSRSRSS